eukprot:4563127-Amphidinium_carterae.1
MTTLRLMALFWALCVVLYSASWVWNIVVLSVSEFAVSHGKDLISRLKNPSLFPKHVHTPSRHTYKMVTCVWRSFPKVLAMTSEEV